MSETHLTLVPAFGRDYRSRDAVLADWKADKDFIIRNWDHAYYGRPVNRSQAIQAGVPGVSIRYRNRKSIVVLNGDDV